MSLIIPLTCLTYLGLTYKLIADVRHMFSDHNLCFQMLPWNRVQAEIAICCIHFSINVRNIGSVRPGSADWSIITKTQKISSKTIFDRFKLKKLLFKIISLWKKKKFILIIDSKLIMRRYKLADRDLKKYFKSSLWCTVYKYSNVRRENWMVVKFTISQM